MAVIPRGSDAQPDGGAGQIGSPRVATSTVIGMVLGICERSRILVHVKYSADIRF